MNNFRHRVLRIEPNNAAVQRVLVGALALHLDKKFLIKNSRREPGRDVKILSDRMLGIKGSAEHSRWTCVDRPSCSVDKNYTARRTENAFGNDDCLRPPACFL